MGRLETSERFRRFARHEAAGSSPVYEALTSAIADDVDLIARLDGLPPPKRQPNLLLAACRYLELPIADADAATARIRERWAEIRAIVLERRTQTNEPARTATFLPLLARLAQPLALIEVGASAGLCLFPDRYRVRYDDHPAIGPNDSPVAIDVATNGAVPVPARMPEVVWRAGIDLNPLDVNDLDDVAWLDACIWPEHDDRRRRLVGAVSVAASEPPELIAGDLVDEIGDLLDRVPDSTTPVVFHSAVLNYLEPERRATFQRYLAGRDAVWLSNEAAGVVAGLPAPTDLGPSATFVLGVDGERAVALSHPHGRWLHWIG